MVQIKKQNIKVLDFADRTVDGYNRSTETAKNCLITSRNIGTVWTERRDPADSIKLQHLYTSACMVLLVLCKYQDFNNHTIGTEQGSHKNLVLISDERRTSVQS